MLLKFIGATLLTYFSSRLTNTLPLRGSLVARLLASHCLSFLGIGLLLFSLRAPLGAFDARQLVIFPPPQFFWLCFDLLRQYRPKAGRKSG